MTSLGDYISWLKDQKGTFHESSGPDPEIGRAPVIKLISPDGQNSVLHYWSDRTELLTPSLIDHFDRRLQVKSPFRSKRS